MWTKDENQELLTYYKKYQHITTTARRFLKAHKDIVSLSALQQQITRLIRRDAGSCNVEQNPQCSPDNFIGDGNVLGRISRSSHTSECSLEQCNLDMSFAMSAQGDDEIRLNPSDFLNEPAGPIEITEDASLALDDKTLNSLFADNPESVLNELF